MQAQSEIDAAMQEQGGNQNGVQEIQNQGKEEINMNSDKNTNNQGGI